MKKLLAIMLSLAMVLSLVPMAAVVASAEDDYVVKKIIYDFEGETVPEGVSYAKMRGNRTGVTELNSASGSKSFSFVNSSAVWNMVNSFVGTNVMDLSYVRMAMPTDITVLGSVGFSFNSTQQHTSSYQAFGVEMADGTYYFTKYRNVNQGTWHSINMMGEILYKLDDNSETKQLTAADFAQDAENKVVALIVADGGTADDGDHMRSYIDDVYYEGAPDSFTVTIDGENPTTVIEGKDFTFPEMDGVEKYTPDGENYFAAGETMAIWGNTDFTTVYRAITEDDFTFDLSDKTYTGEVIAPEVTSETLTEDDFEVSYPNNIAIGAGEIVVKGTGHYYGTVEKTFNIIAKDITAEDFAAISDQEYTGAEITPDVVSETLETQWFEVSGYANNTNVGQASVTVIGVANYKGEVTINFNIVEKAITESDFVFDNADVIYNGTEFTPEVSSETLGENDYDVAYSDNTNAGTATVTVTGKGNYKGEVTFTFAILAKEITEADFEVDTAEKEFDGTQITPEVSTSVLGSDDYAVSYSDNTDAGTATITITGAGNYTGELTYNFTINAKELADADFAAVEDVVYTGSAITPEVAAQSAIVTVDDYDVAYADNENVGTATITIIGKRNFVGTVTMTFDIATKEIAEEDFAFDVEDKVYTGAAIAPAVTAEALKEADFEVAYADNTNVGTATITVTGKGNTTGTVTKTFKITAKAIAEADFTVDTADVVYTGSAITKEVKSTLAADAYTVAFANNTAVGTATITITGKGNYTGTITKTFNITEKKVEKPAPDKVKAKKPAKVKKVTAKSKAKKKVTVTWKAAKNAKKYIVKYSYKKNMKKAKTITVKKAKATLKKLKSGKKVYIQIQGVNGKVKGKLSAKKSVKVK